MSKWISVDVRLPRIDQLVLGVSPTGGIAVYSRDDYGNEGWLWAQQQWAWNLADTGGIECDDEYVVTHWMPLPIAPEVRK